MTLCVSEGFRRAAHSPIKTTLLPEIAANLLNPVSMRVPRGSALLNLSRKRLIPRDLAAKNSPDSKNSRKIVSLRD